MSPFDPRHLQQLNRREWRPQQERPVPAPTLWDGTGTKTAFVLGKLKENEYTASELASMVGIRSGKVYSLLANYISSGAVLLEDGIYRLNAEPVDPKIVRAVRVLRGAGWTVQPPRKA
jgi:hypothetical protein